MRIGELSERTNTSRRLLRYHEEQGLLFSERSSNGYRSYDERYVDRVPQIRGLLDARPAPPRRRRHEPRPLRSPRRSPPQRQHRLHPAPPRPLHPDLARLPRRRPLNTELAGKAATVIPGCTVTAKGAPFNVSDHATYNDPHETDTAALLADAVQRARSQ